MEQARTCVAARRANTHPLLKGPPDHEQSVNQAAHNFAVASFYGRIPLIVLQRQATRTLMVAYRHSYTMAYADD